MSSDGGESSNKPPGPPSTIAGVVPQPPRHGLPPPTRPGSASQMPPFRPATAPPPPQGPQQPPPQPFAAPQQPTAPPPQSPLAAPPPPQGQQPPQQPFAAPQQPTAPPPQSPLAAPPPPSPFAPAPQASPFAAAPPPSPFAAAPQPSPFAGSQQPFDPAMPSPFAMAPQGPSHQPVPTAQLVQSEAGVIDKAVDVLEEVPGRFVGFLKISAKRAFRLRIEPKEVLPDERAELERSNPPITGANLQAFLAWRRSVVFLVATILTVLSIMGLVDSLGGSKVASPVRFVKLLPTLAEVAFCAICWIQLRNWTNWRKQRRWLLIGWLLFMLTPFAVFIYPLKTAVMDAGRAMTVEQMRELGYHGVYNKVVAPFAFAMIAMLQLAPKVISLMPGLIRSSMVVKLLFPGASAPGWLIVMCAPLYAMIAYAILVIPYQFTAEPWFMFGVLLIMFAQVLVMRSGYALARPLTEEEALRHIKRIRAFYMALLLTAAASIIGGLGLLVKLLHMKWTTVITTILKFEANVMILTTIGADLVMTNLDRARGYTEGKEQLEAETEMKIASFVGLNAPPTPPPPGPAQH